MTDRIPPDRLELLQEATRLLCDALRVATGDMSHDEELGVIGGACAIEFRKRAGGDDPTLAYVAAGLLCERTMLSLRMLEATDMREQGCGRGQPAVH